MTMVLLIFFLFVSVPVVEIAIFISVGGYLGLWPTLGAILLTAALGATLLRHQGLQTLMRARAALNENRAPVAEVFEGACLVFAGALLLTPGFMTDAVGFALMIPAIRQLIIARIVARAAVRVQGNWQSTSHPSGTPDPETPSRSPGRGPIIDGEFEDLTTEPGNDSDASQDALPPTDKSSKP